MRYLLGLDLSNHPLVNIFSSERENVPDSLRILTTESSASLWKDIFGIPDERINFPSNHWINTAEWHPLEMNWLELYNSDSCSVGDELKQRVDIQGKNAVYFLKDPYEAVEIAWGEFVSNTDEFIEFDDESFLWIPSQSLLLLFTTFGQIRSATGGWGQIAHMLLPTLDKHPCDLPPDG